MPEAHPETRSEKNDTRLRILHATLELVGREGIAALSNRRIAVEAGVSLGTLTYHFASQTELLRESLLLYVEEEVARLEAIAADLRARCPSLPEVAAEIQKIAADTAKRPEQIAELELHLQAARDPALQEASRRCFAAYDGVAAAALSVLGVSDPERHARTVVVFLIGMSVRRQGTGIDDAAGLVDGLQAIVRGARPRRSAQSPRPERETAAESTR